MNLNLLIQVVAAILVCGMAMQARQARAGVEDGLLLHLDFEGDFLDQTVNGYDGQDIGGISLGAGIDGISATFDGSDDQLLFPGFPDEQLAAGDLTFAYWFQVPAPAIMSFLSKREVCSSHPFFDIRMQVDRAMLLETADDLGTFGVYTNAADAGWHHVAFTRADRNLRAYLNGRLVDSGDTPRDFDFTNKATLGLSNSPCIGLDGTQMLSGSVDELRIYSRALSGHEIFKLYAIFSGGFEDQE